MSEEPKLKPSPFPKALKILRELNKAEKEGIIFNSFGNPEKKKEVSEALKELKAWNRRPK